MPANLFNTDWVRHADTAVALGANFLLQSTLLAGAGLAAAWFCRKKGAAVQSWILRATLVALFVAPLAAPLWRAFGLQPWRFQLPTGQRSQTQVAVGPTTFPATAASAPAGSASTPKTSDGLGGGQAAPSGQDSPTAIPGAAAKAETPAEAISRPAPQFSGLGLLYCLLTGCWVLGSLVLLLRLIVCHCRLGSLRWHSNMAAVPVFERCQALARGVRVTPPEVRGTRRSIVRCWWGCCGRRSCCQTWRMPPASSRPRRYWHMNWRTWRVEIASGTCWAAWPRPSCSTNRYCGS